MKNNTPILKLGIAISFCLALVSIRILKSGQLFYLFLVWNLFLALLPYFISSLLEKRSYFQKNSIWFWGVFLVWLSLLPNAPYIITDLQHIRLCDKQEIWYDVILIASFAITGLWAGLRSIRNMETLLSHRFNALQSRILTVLICFLCGFGIYLGRFLRWNSWDIIQRPLILLDDIIARIAHPIHYSQTWSFTFIFGSFILITYLLMTPLIANKKIAPNHY